VGGTGFITWPIVLISLEEYWPTLDDAPHQESVKGTEGMAQLMECLPSKHKALSSNPSTTKGRERESQLKQYMVAHANNSSA
jgi:hypothetical protein